LSHAESFEIHLSKSARYFGALQFSSLDFQSILQNLHALYHVTFIDALNW